MAPYSSLSLTAYGIMLHLGQEKWLLAFLSLYNLKRKE
ncbi:hypothetical protein DSBG_0622 [Desulfosporosinus sp. BG]|nr:hypothetical protein DSBG_0622 [Desulfosporosinus sp. BG]